LSCVLFNLQGAFAFRYHFRDSLFSISHSLAFVKYFFKFFQTLFSAPSLATACILYHISSALSIPFFNFFPELFQVSSSCSSSIFHRLIADSSVILTYLFPFVKHFCITFLSFFDYFHQNLTYPHISTAFPQPYPQFVLIFCFISYVFHSGSGKQLPYNGLRIP